MLKEIEISHYVTLKIGKKKNNQKKKTCIQVRFLGHQKKISECKVSDCLHKNKTTTIKPRDSLLNFKEARGQGSSDRVLA